MQWNTVAIIGVGLIGGSVGLALKERKLARQVVGIGRRRSRLSMARRRGLIDSAATQLGRGVAEAELTIVCTPVTQIADFVRQAAEHGPEGALLTDTGSTKAQLVHELDGTLANGALFVGSHPLAGSEKQGFEHARADLFEGAVCVLTPTRRTPRACIKRVSEFWQSLGAKISRMSPEAHDRAMASSSHLPHLVAAALSSTLPLSERRLAATGFRDTTRIAAGDPALWAGILAQNREATRDALREFERHLQRFDRALRQGDWETLRKLLADAKRRRDALGS